MADLILSVSRTVIQVKGKIINQKGLHEVFDEACGGRLASMHLSYNKKEDITKILLSPCRVVEEFTQDNQGKQLNCRTTFIVDKSIMHDIIKECGDKDAFIEKVWMPYKKARTEDNIALPVVFEKADCFSFELLSCSLRKGSKKATTAFRNRTMGAAKVFFLELFAKRAKDAKKSKPSARLLDELSMIIGEAAYDSEKSYQ